MKSKKPKLRIISEESNLTQEHIKYFKVLVPVYLFFNGKFGTKCVDSENIELILPFLDMGDGKFWILKDKQFLIQYFFTHNKLFENVSDKIDIKNEVYDNFDFIKINEIKYSLNFNNYAKLRFDKLTIIVPRVIEVIIVDRDNMRKYKIYSLVNSVDEDI